MVQKMVNIINRLKKLFIKNKYNIIVLFLGSIYFSFLVFIHDARFADFEFFVKEPLSLTYGIDRWFSWSSRLLIESSVNIFSKNLFLWGLITIIFGAILFWSLNRILGNRRISQSLLMFSLLLLTNFFILTSAGIFATTINYLWPISCFSFVIAMLLRPFKNEKMKTVSNIIIWPLYIFAMCNEQIALLGIILFAGFIVYNLYSKKRIPKKMIILLILSCIGLINVLICPGNSARTSIETGNYWPEFANFNIKNKIIVGSVVTFSRLFFGPELLAVLIVILIMVLAYKKSNIKAFFAILPASVVLFLSFWPLNESVTNTNVKLVNYLNHLRSLALNIAPNNFPDSHNVKIYLVIFFCICISIIIAIYFLYGRTKKTLILLYLLAAGIAVTMAVSLSPTMFASSTRTLYVFVIILLCVDFIIAQDILKDKFKLKNSITATLSKK